MKHYLLGFLAFLVTGALMAANPAPKIDGLWEVRYDASNTPSAHIRITTQPNGELTGVIEDAFPRPGEQGSAYCTECTGANKDKPVKGLMVLWGMQPSGDNEWKGGHVLNAETGKIYSGTMTLADNGNELDMRGYILTPILGDTSTWRRIQ